MFGDFIFSFRDFLNHIRFIKRSPLVLPRIIEGIIRVNLFKQPRLRVVEIAVDYACDGWCLFCSAAKFFVPKKEKNRLTVEEFKKIGKTLDKMGVVGIVITGGEPLLRPDLEEIIKALNPKNKIISVVTNALTLTQKRVNSLAKAGVNSIEFSLESDNEKENDKIRNTKGHFKKVLKGIAWVKKTSLNVCLSPCLTHQNIHYFENFIHFAKKLDAFILLSLAGDVGRWSDKENIVLTKDDWKLMEKYRKKYPFIRNDFSTNYILREGCPAGREKFYISAYGDVIPCSFTHISFGSLRKESLEIIWNRMRNFPPFKKYFPYCRRTRDRKFTKTYLDPLKRTKTIPYPINKLLKKLDKKPLK